MKNRLLICVFLFFALMPGMIVCAQADGLEPALTVNGSDTSASVAFNEAPQIQICAPGATAVRLWARRVGQDDNPKSWDRVFDRYEVCTILEENGMKMFDTGTWLITADYTTDDYDDGTDLYEAPLNWTDIGTGVTVRVSNWIARLDAPEAVLSNDVVTQGEMFTLTLSSFQHKGEWYWVETEMLTDEGEWTNLDHIDAPFSEDLCDSMRFDTSNREPGSYRLWLRCEAVGYEDAGTYLPFTVKAATETLPEVSLKLSADGSAFTYQNVSLYANAPGADRMEIEIEWDASDYWSDGRSGDGSSNVWSWSSTDAGHYTFTLKAWWGDEVRTADPVELTLNAPYGDLDEPTVENIPSLIESGTAIDGSFNPVDFADGYHIRLEYYDYSADEWQTLVSFHRALTGGLNTALSLPGALFEREGKYALHVDAHRTGWNGGHLDYTIWVRQSIAETLTLTVNGGTEDIQDYLSLKDFYVNVELPESATAIRLLNGDDWEFFDAQSFDGVNWCMGRGEYTLIALATEDEPVWRVDGFDWSSFNWDDCDWNLISNTVQLTVISPYGTLDNPVLSVPESVARGDWLNVTIDAVSDAQRYHLRLFHRNAEGNEDECAFNQWYESAGTYVIPTATLTEGESWFLCVWSDAEGYDSGCTERMLTVTDGSQDEHFKVSATEVLTNEPICVSIYVPGAQCIRMTQETNLLFEETAESLADTVSFDQPGTYELKAITPDGDGWRVIQDVISIQVTAPYGAIEAGIDAPLSVSANGTAEFSVTWRHEGVRCFDETTLCDQNGQDQPIELVSSAEGEAETTRVYRVHGDDLQAGQTYIIELWVRPEASGYEPTRVLSELAVLDVTQAGSVLVSRDEVLRCEESTVTVDVPGATALWIYHGEERWDGFVGDHVEVTWPFYRVGANAVYARYTTEEIENPEQVDFASLSYSGCTPVASVVVRSLGVLDKPDFTLENEIVARGEPFRFTINALQGHDEWYIGWLNDLEGQAVTQNFFWDETHQSLRVETADVEPGLYFLRLHGDAIGYESCDVEFFVAVEEPADGITVSLPDSPVLTQEMPYVTAYAQGAESITMEISDPNGEVRTRTWQQAGERFYAEVVFADYACMRHVTFTATYADGTTQVKEADIEVVAPYGTRENPNLCMTGPWIEGEDFVFRVDAGSALFIVVDIQDRRTGEYVYSDEEINFDDWRYTIPADVFTPGHLYNVIVFSTEVGYNCNETLFWMAMLPQQPDTLRLPAGLTQIESEAFAGVGAQKIVIPSNVTSVADRAFAGCPNILAVEIEDGAQGISLDAFEDSGAFMIYAEAGSTAADYAISNPWATYIRLE